MPTSLPPPQTSGLSFSLPASSLFASPFELSVMIRLTHSPPPLLGRLLSFRTNVDDFDHSRLNHPLNQAPPADDKRAENITIVQEDDVKGLDMAVVVLIGSA